MSKYITWICKTTWYKHTRQNKTMYIFYELYCMILTRPLWYLSDVCLTHISTGQVGSEYWATSLIKLMNLEKVGWCIAVAKFNLIWCWCQRCVSGLDLCMSTLSGRVHSLFISKHMYMLYFLGTMKKIGPHFDFLNLHLWLYQKLSEWQLLMRAKTINLSKCHFTFQTLSLVTLFDSFHWTLNKLVLFFCGISFSICDWFNYVLFQSLRQFW